LLKINILDMKLRDAAKLGLWLFLAILLAIGLVASILFYPVIVEASANLTKMIFHALGLN